MILVNGICNERLNFDETPERFTSIEIDSKEWCDALALAVERFREKRGAIVRLCEFDCDGTHPVSGTEAFLAIENFDKPGKWRLVAERIG